MEACGFWYCWDLDESAATLTWAGHGTLPYMAPEIFAPPYASSIKTDLYALGCIAYELEADILPFLDSDRAMLMRKIRTEPAPERPESVNYTMRRLIGRQLAKDPSLRPQDAWAVKEELDRVVMVRLLRKPHFCNDSPRAMTLSDLSNSALFFHQLSRPVRRRSAVLKVPVITPDPDTAVSPARRIRKSQFEPGRACSAKPLYIRSCKCEKHSWTTVGFLNVS